MIKEEYRGYRDLKTYQIAYALTLEIHEITKEFPTEEKFSLVDQMRRSSRSVSANISEAWKKRRYRKYFISKLTDSSSEASKTEVWLDFSKDLGYLEKSKYSDLISRYNEVGRMLNGMIKNVDKFCS